MSPEPPISLRSVLHLGQAVLDRDHLLAVVDVKSGLELEPLDRRRVDAVHPPLRVLGEDVTAARLAELAVRRAGVGLHVRADLVGALGHLDRVRRP
jgi:hypothetical protein